MEPLTTYFPFGPPIGYAKLPKELVDDFNEGCDNIVNDKKLSKSEDYSRKLVGQVQQELLIKVMQGYFKQKFNLNAQTNILKNHKKITLKV